MSEEAYPGWTWEFFTRCWVRGDGRIYPVNGAFVIASGDVWLPGSFPTFEDAEKAINGAALGATPAFAEFAMIETPTMPNTAIPDDAELLAMASAFDLIPFNPRGRAGHLRELKVERRRTDPEAWAIVSQGEVLARDHWWYFERTPSNRTDEFLALTRWPDARSAIAFAREHMRLHPTGYIPDQV